MPHTLFIRVNPDCLNQVEYEKNASARQNTFLKSIKDLHATVNLLKKQIDFQFDKIQEKEVSRGAFYALTLSLEEKFTQQSVITLADLQNVLKNEFYRNESTSNFIIQSLLEPHSLPFALAVVAYSMLTDDSFWSNECTTLDSGFKYSLKAERDPSENIIFNMTLNLRNVQCRENSSLGSLSIQFAIGQQRQIKLLPMDMEFNFVEKKALKQFKKELCSDFRDWIFLRKGHWPIADLWVIPILLGCLFGLMAMISLLALSLTPISPLLLPAIGLVLGLGLASMMHACVHISIKNQQEKLQRPIYIFHRKPMQTVAPFFSYPNRITVMASKCNERGGHQQFYVPGL